MIKKCDSWNSWNRQLRLQFTFKPFRYEIAWVKIIGYFRLEICYLVFWRSLEVFEKKYQRQRMAIKKQLVSFYDYVWSRKYFYLCKIQLEQRSLLIHYNTLHLKQWSKCHTLNLKQTNRLHYIFRMQFCSNITVPARVRQCCLSTFNRMNWVFPRIIPKFQISKHIRLTHGFKNSLHKSRHIALRSCWSNQMHRGWAA